MIDFLRIQVYMDDLDALGDDDVGALMTSIEETVTAHDDRVPSVRFSPP